MNILRTSTNAIRHRLLEGVLLRLARLPDAGGLVLRGGMLLRHWFRPHVRHAADLDLVAAGPLSCPEVRERYVPLFADASVADGVAFDSGRLMLEGIWMQTPNPGVRIRVLGMAAGREAEVKIDVTGGPMVVPAPVWGTLPTASGTPVHVWMCRPEAIVGQKVQALWHMGIERWRSKDLHDLQLLLTRLPLVPAAVRLAVWALMTDLGATTAEACGVFSPESWLHQKRAAARWSDCVDSSREWSCLPELAVIVAEVAGLLRPMLEGFS